MTRRCTAPIRPSGRFLFRRSLQSALAAMLVLVMVTGTTAAAGDPITDLGQVTNSIPQPPSPPTGNFHRSGPVLQQHGKPELLFIGTMVASFEQGGESASERWALVKALNQFGHLTGVNAVETNRCTATSARDHRCFPNDTPIPRYPTEIHGYPTFDLSHARYTSRYLTLVAKDVIDEQLHVQTNLSPLETSLVKRYIGKHYYNPGGKWADLVWNMSSNPPENQGLPLVSIGGYLQIYSGQALVGDLTPMTTGSPVPFSTVQNSLRRGKAMGGLPFSLIPDFNSETNVLTALICRADGMKPATVCSRTAVKSILKHIH